MDDLSNLHPNGLFLRREAMLFGYDDRDLARLLAAGELVRVRHGTYVPATAWHGADPVQRHLLRAQGVALTHGHRVALSHTTGAVGLRTWEPDLSRVHVTRLTGTTGRREHDVAYHREAWDPDDVCALDELLVLRPTLTALQAASISSIEAGVVLLDSLLDLDLGDEEGLLAAYASMSHFPFSRRLQITLRLARRGSQSVGESRMRFLFWAQHLPEPVLQYPIYDGRRLVGITDFAWPEYKMLGEFDGKLKYGKGLRAGESPTDAVFREKRREDEIREVSGMGMIRYTYGDLYVPRTTAERTRRMLRDPKAA